MTLSWLAVVGAFLGGLLSWLVPFVAFGLTYLFTAGNHAYQLEDLLIISGVALVLVAATPLGVMGWYKWYQGMAAFAVGLLAGLGPVAALLLWFSQYLK
jgi:hypothetical protein